MDERALGTRQAYPKTTGGPRSAWTLAAAAAAAAIAGGAAVLLAIGPSAAAAALRQTWPPFALVTGLILIGRVADRDGVFDVAGSRLAALGGGAVVLLFGLLALVAAVTVVLNLDTAVVFLTPVLVHAARSRQIDERPFVYGTVFMSNSASLLLPGSNLTNLIVLDGSNLPGLEFARAMLVPWLAAVLITGGLMWLLHWQAVRGGAAVRGETTHMHGRTGCAAIAAASAMVLVLHDPALPVLALGVGLTGWRQLRQRGAPLPLLRTVPLELAILFAVAVSVGTIARLIPIPAGIAAAGPAQAVAVGSISAIVMNNLPAAALLSAHAPAHPLFLLVGLNIGPNLFITGSLSAVLWLRIARQAGTVASAGRYLRLGLIVAPLALAGAATILSFSAPPA